MVKNPLSPERLNIAEKEKTIADCTIETTAHFFLAGNDCFVVPLEGYAAYSEPASKNDEYTLIGQLKLGDQSYLVLTESPNDQKTVSNPGPSASKVLTKRELQIAILVANGKVNKQIAHMLHLSEWTVSTHLRRIYAKLCVNSRAQMVHLIMSDLL